MVFNKIRYLSYLTVIKDASVLKHRIAIALDEELGRTTLSEFAVAGMHVHTLHHAERRKIQVITCRQ